MVAAAKNGGPPVPAVVADDTAGPASVPNPDLGGGEGPPPLPDAGLATPPAGAVAVLQGVCVAVAGSVGAVDYNLVIRDRWSMVKTLLHTFLAEPVIGAFAGIKRDKIRRLAARMMQSTGNNTWRRRAAAVESVGILWPMLRLQFNEIASPLMVRAVDELIMETCGKDANWETLWRRRASPAALDYKRMWKTTSVDQVAA